MIDFTVETEIARSPADVFAYVTDPAKLASWQANTVSAVLEGGGPLRVGSRLREVHRGPGGKQLESLVEVSELQRDRLFSLRVLEGPLPVDARISLEASQAGTRMRFNAHGEPSGPALSAAAHAPGAETKFREHCTTLKHALEQRPVGGA